MPPYGSTTPKKRISLVVPFFNEGDNIDAFRRRIEAVMSDCADYDFELLCIDDGSSDNTLSRLCSLAAEDTRYHVIEFSRNFGKEAALTAGINEATGDALIPLDADLQDPPELIPRMLEKWQAGAEVVLCRRSSRASDSFLKRKTAYWFYRLHSKLSDIQIPSDAGDFRLMDRVVVDAIKRLPERQRFMKGLFAWVGFVTDEIAYERPVRNAGNSKFSFWKLWNFALDGLTSFSTLPLRIWTYIGACGALLTFGYIVFIIARTLVHGIDVPGYASLLVAVLFFGSLQLVSIGLVGEYIGRIYAESKQRPIYVIRSHYGKHP